MRDRCNLLAVDHANLQTIIPCIGNDDVLAVDDNAASLFKAADNALFLDFWAGFQPELPDVAAPVALDRKMVACLVHSSFQVVVVVFRLKGTLPARDIHRTVRAKMKVGVRREPKGR